ncbi:hypothetical protein Pelo_96 [Pelomyxa schiedti]|nr:hypothetical protein Pelo_96 [Pelomyxa schiedti]
MDSNRLEAVQKIMGLYSGSKVQQKVLLEEYFSPYVEFEDPMMIAKGRAEIETQFMSIPVFWKDVAVVIWHAGPKGNNNDVWLVEWEFSGKPKLLPFLHQRMRVHTTIEFVPTTTAAMPASGIGAASKLGAVSPTATGVTTTTTSTLPAEGLTQAGSAIHPAKRNVVRHIVDEWSLSGIAANVPIFSRIYAPLRRGFGRASSFIMTPLSHRGVEVQPTEGAH